jgi:hypothetical protein
MSDLRSLFVMSGAAICLATASLAASLTPRRHVAAVDPCALPAGFDLDAVGPQDRSLALRRALLCRDLEHGRISIEAYRAHTRELDEASGRPAAPQLVAAEVPPTIAWAARVVAWSSQYSETSWSAARVIGPPDVYPRGGDDVNAWASLGADDRVEFLEVAFDRPHRLSGVDVYETFNPGAVTRIELIGVDGSRQVVHAQGAQPIGRPSHLGQVRFPCTETAIAAVRVTIDSPSVAGWNEIDAIGGVTCLRD